VNDVSDSDPNLVDESKFPFIALWQAGVTERQRVHQQSMATSFNASSYVRQNNSGYQTPKL